MSPIPNVIDPAQILYYFLGLFKGSGDETLNVLASTWGILVAISAVVSFLFLFGIIYSFVRLRTIRIKEREKYYVAIEQGYIDVTQKQDDELSQRWRKVMELVDSENQNDWKMAIIEADIMLDYVLGKMGYQGTGVGEKLKRVERGDMETLDEAWEAHKVRNSLAHESAVGESGFVLGQHEAKRVIQLFRKVFDEFYYI